MVKNQNYHTNCMLHPRGWTGINPDVHTNWPMLHPTLHPDANWLVGLRHAWALVNMLVCVVSITSKCGVTRGWWLWRMYICVASLLGTVVVSFSLSNAFVKECPSSIRDLSSIALKSTMIGASPEPAPM